MNRSSGHRVDDAGYGAGALATGAFGTLPGLILLYYMTDTLAIPAAVAGVVVFIPKLCEVLLNPLVGRLSDRTRTRFGARRPWILVGALIFPLAFAATFWTPLSGAPAAVWVAVTFSIASMFFSAFVVPWSSLPAEIAPDTEARTSMAAWRIAFVAIAILISGGLAPAIVEAAGDARSGYRAMALFMGGVMMAGALTAVFLGGRRSTPVTTLPAPAGGFRAGLRLLVTSPPLIAMFWLVALTEIAAAVSLASAPYLADYVLGDPGAVAILFVLLTIPLLITMPAWRRIALGLGKRKALRLALVIFAAGAVLLATVTIAPVAAKTWIACVSLFIMGIGFAGTSMLPQAMFADTLAYEGTRRGESSNGAMTGAWNAAEALAGGAGAASFAFVLTLAGFISAGEDQIVQQPATAIIAIALAASLIPAAAALIAWWPLGLFTLAEETVDAVVQGPSAEDA